MGNSYLYKPKKFIMGGFWEYTFQLSDSHLIVVDYTVLSTYLFLGKGFCAQNTCWIEALPGIQIEKFKFT